MSETRQSELAVLLSAYLDGELDAHRQLEVELWLVRDAEARRLMEELRRTDRALRSAFAPVLDEAPPADLLRRIEAAAAGRSRSPFLGRRWRHQPLVWALAAACLLLMAAVPAAWFWGSEHGRQSEAATRLAGAGERAALEASLQAALQEALERKASGETLPWQEAAGAGGEGEILPVRTYRSRGGQWCREYRIEAWIGSDPMQERGIACRSQAGADGPARWERKVLFLDGGGLPPLPQRPI